MCGAEPMASAKRGRIVPSSAVASKILVADDVSFNRQILKQLLRKLGYDVVECSTGQEAVTAFKETDDLLCVLMDINMPDMDGLEASLHIRQLEAEAQQLCASAAGEATVPGCSTSSCQNAGPADPRYCSPARRVPIWAVSACSEQEQYCSPALAHIAPDSHNGPPWKLAGIDAFVPKPIDVCHLTDMIFGLQNELNGQSLRSLTGALSEAEVKQWPGTQPAGKRSLGPYLDLHSAKRACTIDTDMALPRRVGSKADHILAPQVPVLLE